MLSNTSTKTYDIFNMNMSFNIDDIKSMEELHARTKNEAQQIFSKPGPRRGRSYDQIYETALMGHTAEQYLIETGWEDDERPYKDLFDPHGESVEIKVRRSEERLEQAINGPCNFTKSCREIRTEKSMYPPFKVNWRNFPDIVYGFINETGSKEYFHKGVYVWNGKMYVLLP